jgi:hypothetical protein
MNIPATTLGQKILGGIVLALVLAVGVQTVRLRREQQAQRDQAFRADSIAAALDTTRAVSARAQQILGDSLRGVERRAVQVAGITPDELDKALRRYSTSIIATVASIKPLIDVQRTAPVTVNAQDERKADFVVDSAPYHVRAAVALPAPPANGRIGLSVRLDTAHVSYRIQCGKAKDGGVQPASVEISSPPWLSMGITNATTDQNVCNPQQTKGSIWKDLLWGAAGIGAGWLIFH